MKWHINKLYHYYEIVERDRKLKKKILKIPWVLIFLVLLFYYKKVLKILFIK